MVVLWLALQTSVVQNYIVQKVTVKLSRNLHAKVSIKHVDFILFNKMLLQGALVLDRKNDTLLYAGTAKVNITDWFFFKDNIVLKYVGLDDGIINLKRKDSVWNYQFMIDYFSSPAKKKDTSTNVVRLDLNTVELNRFKIWQQDQWIGQDVLVSVNKLNLSTDQFDMNNNIIRLNTLSLDEPVFSQYDYTGLRPVLNSPSTKLVNDDYVAEKPALQWNTDSWLFTIKNLRIKNGSIAIGTFTERASFVDLFDDKHISFSSISANVKNFQFIKDTLTADVELAAKEHSGFQLKELTAGFRFTPGLMEFNNLNLVTAKTHLKNYYAMRYNSFNKDMGNFVHAVKLEGDFKNSNISTDDLAFFIPSVKDWKRNFSINGKVTGAVDNLSARNITIQSGSENYFNGDFAIRGLPDIDESYINLKSNNLKTSYTELANLMPGLKSIATPDLSALGNINFSGKFTGFTNDFVTYGTINTGIGTVKTDINMKFPANGAPVYYGKIFTDNFQLGKFIHSSDIGNVSFNGTVSGNGFNENNMDISIDGFIRQVEFNKYNYQNITAKGNLNNKMFLGSVSIDDPNLQISDLVGAINFKAKEPEFNFEADVLKFNLKNLHFTNDNFSLTGRLNLNFSGDNIDNFLGSAGIYNAVLLRDDQKLSFDSLTINSSFSNGIKNLTVNTNELEASITGTFKIAELPDAFQLFLNRYYPVYIPKPNKKLQNEDFVFDIQTKNIAEYILLIDKRLKGFDNSKISGSLNLAQNTLNVNTIVPAFSYGPTDFYNSDFFAAGNFDSLTVNGNIEDIVINDSLHSPGTKIVVVAHNDISDVSIKTSANKTLTEADLSARIQTLSDGFKLNFNPSSFVINNKKWTLEKGGELVLSKTSLMANEVKFSQDEQQLIISTEPSSTGNTNDLVVDLKKINIADIAPLFIKDPRVEGLMTGNVRVTDPFKNIAVDFDTQIERFYLENDSIGILKTTGSYTARSGDVIVNAIADNDLYNFTASMAYKTTDSSNNQLKGMLNLHHANIHVVEKYLSTIFSGMNGDATGQLNISGTTKSPKLTGSVRLNNATITVNYTRSRYIFENNSVINFNADEIDFGTIKLRDTLNNTATVSGKLYHNFFDDFFFNEINFKTDRKNGNPGKFVLLNTGPKDNNQFYGSIIGDAEMSLNGPLTDMRMVIRGEPTDSSHIYLPTGETAETGKIDYIEFIKFGREMKTDLTLRQETNIKVDIEISANPFAKIDVILDETTKDIIKAQGNGKLNISAGTRDPLTIRGRYEVQQGQYTFNFQTFLKTPFILQQGYIEWQGDPYLANLNIDAVYRAQKVDLSSIPTSNGLPLKDRGDVDIIFKLRGTLKDPSPDFEFQFTFDNPLKIDPIANEYLKTRFQADKNEMNKQVTSLLLFNSFISEQQRLFSTNNTGNFVTRTLGQILSNTLSSSLNNWLQKLLKTDQVNLYTNINTSDFNFEKGITQKQIQNLGNFGFKTSFLKNRLLINFGGNVDYKLIQSTSNSNSNFLFTPDVSFEYLITPDGKFRVVGFNRSDAGIGDIAGITRRNRTGVLLSYRKDFNTFSEFFGAKKN
ncbi:MAG: translocation/assembly module TamB domain-containing protein [Ginsengibacter sp.]